MHRLIIAQDSITETQKTETDDEPMNAGKRMTSSGTEKLWASVCRER